MTTAWPEAALRRLGDICEVRRGTMITEKESTPGEVPVIAGGLGPSYYHSTPNRSQAVTTVSASGANAGHIGYWDIPIWASDCTTVEPDDSGSVAGRFMFHQLKVMETRIQATLRRGAAQPHVYAKDIADLEVRLPPLEEQKRIVSILDAADGLRTKRQQAIDQLDTLIEVIFHDMFGGSGRALVNSRAVGERHPAGWSWVPITSVAEMATGHTPDRNVTDYWDGEISWINLSEIRTFDGWWCEETVARVTPEGVANSSAVILPAGTVCFSRTASIGFVTVMANPMTTSQDFVNWLCGDDLNPVFLMHSLRMARETLRASSSGSTHKTIYLRDAERLLILLPPRTLQDEYVQRVTCIEKSKAVMGSGLAPVDALFASIQQRAFRGDL